MSRRYELLAWPDVAAAAERGAGVIVPLGAIEQHGPHLPLDTDWFFAHELALRGSADHDVLVVPVTPLGYRSRPSTGGGPRFPGTISLSGATFVAVVREVLERLAAQGFHKAVIYSWHTENRNFAYEAAHLAVESHPALRVVVLEEPFDSLSPATMTALYGDAFPGWPAEHASILETSLMLHLRPDAVDMALARDDGLVDPPPYDVVPQPDHLTTESGILHRASAGRAELGALALPEICAGLARVLDAEFPELRRC